ncbi:MAG: hypothetical protein JOZ75_08495 [Candidatus Dormibacteraeota bacterium]|nr:hypothetical protein [Candidatus Dormibacteraeota bacterium]
MCFTVCVVVLVVPGLYECRGRDVSWWVSDETTGGTDEVAAAARNGEAETRPRVIDAAVNTEASTKALKPRELPRIATCC